MFQLKNEILFLGSFNISFLEYSLYNQICEIDY